MNEYIVGLGGDSSGMSHGMHYPLFVHGLFASVLTLAPVALSLLRWDMISGSLYLEDFMVSRIQIPAQI